MWYRDTLLADLSNGAMEFLRFWATISHCMELEARLSRVPIQKTKTKNKKRMDVTT